MTSLVKAKFIVVPASLQSLSHVLKFPYDKIFQKPFCLTQTASLCFLPLKHHLLLLKYLKLVYLSVQKTFWYLYQSHLKIPRSVSKPFVLTKLYVFLEKSIIVEIYVNKNPLFYQCSQYDYKHKGFCFPQSAEKWLGF